VTLAIGRLRRHFIIIPRNAEEIQKVQIGFFRLNGFPTVVGAVECTQIRIQSPNSNIGERFQIRKGYFSFNLQAICDSDLKIMNYVAR